MITFIKAKRKKSDDQTDFDKYKMSAHEILQNIISEQNKSCYIMPKCIRNRHTKLKMM